MLPSPYRYASAAQIADDISVYYDKVTALKERYVVEFKQYGFDEKHLRTAFIEHPVYRYIRSLHSKESRKKVVNVLHLVAKKLEDDTIHVLNNKPNIFRFVWHKVSIEDFENMLHDLQVNVPGEYIKDACGKRFPVQTNASQSTKKLYKSVFKQVMAYHADKKLISPDMVAAIERIKIKSVDRPSVGRLIPDADLSKITDYLSRQTDQRGMRDAAIFGLLLAAGLRRSEIGLIEYEDIDFENRELKVRGKGDKHAEIPLFAAAWQPLKAYLDVWSPQHHSKYIFTGATRSDGFRAEPLQGAGVRYILRDICKKARVNLIAPHDLRRTFCTDMINKTDVETARFFMRHAKSDTTQRYNMAEKTQMRGVRDMFG